MITTTITCPLGTPAAQRQVTCPRGEKLRLRVTVTSGGVAMDLSDYSILLGWDTATASTPKPAPTRVSGGATGIVDFDVETIALTADRYMFDVWLENETTYERQLICQRSYVGLTGAVAELNLGPAVTMAALAGTVPPGALAISGTATDVDGTLTAASFSVAVNGTAQTPTFTYAAGAWSASVTVAAGAVSVVVTVTDASGATATATRTTTAA
jgi:hypothetical protein